MKNLQLLSLKVALNLRTILSVITITLVFLLSVMLTTARIVIWNDEANTTSTCIYISSITDFNIKRENNPDDDIVTASSNESFNIFDMYNCIASNIYHFLYASSTINISINNEKNNGKSRPKSSRSRFEGGTIKQDLTPLSLLIII